MTTQDIDKLMQTIISMKEHKVVKNRIDKVVFRYLRGFQKDSTVEFYLPITVIVGKNGSGKSTILRSVQLLGKGCIPQNEFFEIEFDEYSTHSEPHRPALRATQSINQSRLYTFSCKMYL